MRSGSLIILILGAVLPAIAQAGSFEVAPTTVNLPSGVRSAAIYLTNRGTEPVNVQIEPYDWQQTDKGDKLTLSQGLMVSPPMVNLPAGRKQTVRLAVNPDSTKNERAFRLLLSQLPDASTPKDQGVQVLLQFSAPVFVAPVEKTPPHLSWHLSRGEGGAILTAHNDGTRHAKINGLNVNGTDIEPNHFWYLLAGSSHDWKLPASIPASGTLTIKAQDETDGMIPATLSAGP